MARRPCCPEAKMACMHEQRSFLHAIAAGAVHCHATLCHYLSRSVSRTCHGPSRPRGARPSKRQGELEGPGQPNLQAGPRVDV
jgi:hypothetical protein